MISSTDRQNHTTEYSYDPLNRLLSRTNPLGFQTQYTYDGIGGLLKWTDANRNTILYQYDSDENLLAMTDALGQQTKYSYDDNNNRSSLTNARGKTTSYTYDAANRRVKITDPLGRSKAFAYDVLGNVVSETDGNGQVVRFTYDDVNRLTFIAYADGSNVSYSYDMDGNRTAMTDHLGTTSYTYDALNRVVSVRRFDGNVVGYTYTPVGKRSSLTYPDGRSVQYQYDSSNKLTNVVDWTGRRETTYAYDQIGNLKTVHLPNGVLSTYGYDAANRLISVLNASPENVLSSFSYVLDNVGNRIQITSGGGTTRYGYDGLNRLTSWSTGSAQASNYVYDSVGNKIAATINGIPVSFSYDDADELLTAGPVSFTYDKSGNRSTKTVGQFTTAYGWDLANRLISVSGPFTNTRYEYDGDGNRVAGVRQSAKSAYVTDILRILPVVISERGSGPSINYLHGGSLIASVIEDNPTYFDHDGLGSTSDISNSAGHSEQEFEYDPWGASPDLINPFRTTTSYRFAGQALDVDGLYYMRARYYDPLVGRFLSRDPVGTRIGNPFDQNRYTYARNNPVRYLDPSGLSTEQSARRDIFNENGPIPNPTPGPNPTPTPPLPGPIPQPLPGPGGTYNSGFYLQQCGSALVSMCVNTALDGSRATIVSPGVTWPPAPGMSFTINYYQGTPPLTEWLNGLSESVTAGEGVVGNVTVNSGGASVGLGFGGGDPISFTTSYGISPSTGDDSGPLYYPDGLDPSGISVGDPNIIFDQTGSSGDDSGAP